MQILSFEMFALFQTLIIMRYKFFYQQLFSPLSENCSLEKMRDLLCKSLLNRDYNITIIVISPFYSTEICGGLIDRLNRLSSFLLNDLSVVSKCRIMGVDSTN